MLFASASEVEVIAKLICKFIDSNKKPETIKQYSEIITPRYSRLYSVELQIIEADLKFQPWAKWNDIDTDERRNDSNTQKKVSPDWWVSYSKEVKHHRNEYYYRANLENTLNSVTGLLVMLLYYYGKVKGTTEFPFHKAPKLFYPQDSKFISGMGGEKFVWTFKLPDT